MLTASPDLEAVCENSRVFQAEQKDDFVVNAYNLLVDEDAVKVAVAWGNAFVRWVRPADPLQFPEGESWESDQKRALFWAWSGARVDTDRLALAANLPIATTISRFRQLRDTQLIFPNGKLAQWTKIAITADVKRRMMGDTHRQKKSAS